MSTEEQRTPDRLPPEIEQELDRYLAEISRGECPDLDAALASIPQQDRAVFRFEALVAEALWQDGEGNRDGVAEVYARITDPGELARVREAVDDASRAGERLPAPLVIGETIFGRYELVSELGRGGIGVVYEARDLELGRRVAIKAVRVDPGRDVSALTQNLVDESRTLAGLDEQDIVTVFDVLRDRDRVCVVLSLIVGKSLEEVVTRIAPLARAGGEVRLEALRAMRRIDPGFARRVPLLDRLRTDADPRIRREARAL